MICASSPKLPQRIRRDARFWALSGLALNCAYIYTIYHLCTCEKYFKSGRFSCLVLFSSVPDREEP